MLELLLSITILLSVVGMNNGKDFGTCDYNINVSVGKTTFIFNDNYPNNYPRGKNCLWVVEGDRPMRLSCNTFDIPFSNACLLSALIIQDGDEKIEHCGNDKINFVSKSTKLVVTLVAEYSLPAGRFFCTVESVPLPNDIGCGCGRRNSALNASDEDMLQTRVVGGEETEINEYPMMCALIDLNLRAILCGATIINERQVITAAHCLNNRPIQEIGVRVAVHDLSKDTEDNNEKLFRVESFTIHPQYNVVSQDYDVAVITIVGAMTFSQKVSPVCLPFQHSPDTFGGVIVHVLGWGSTEFASGPSTTLQKAQLSVINNGICSQHFSGLSARQLCTQGQGRDSCQFDSGGPVLWQNPTTRRLVEIGIISFGSVCADGSPAVNTRVGPVIDWIIEQTPRGISYCTME